MKAKMWKHFERFPYLAYAPSELCMFIALKGSTLRETRRSKLGYGRGGSRPVAGGTTTVMLLSGFPPLLCFPVLWRKTQLCFQALWRKHSYASLGFSRAFKHCEEKHDYAFKYCGENHSYAFNHCGEKHNHAHRFSRAFQHCSALWRKPQLGSPKSIAL